MSMRVALPTTEIPLSPAESCTGACDEAGPLRGSDIGHVIHGEVARGFEGVRDAFAGCFDELGETGAQYAAFVDGRVVADLWRGLARDSLVNVYSVTKPMAAFCVLVLADRGLLS